MSHDPVAGLQGLDDPFAVRRDGPRAGGETVEDPRRGFHESRRSAASRQRREVKRLLLTRSMLRQEERDT